jgi:hypothetical protein
LDGKIAERPTANIERPTSIEKDFDVGRSMFGQPLQRGLSVSPCAF